MSRLPKNHPLRDQQDLSHFHPIARGPFAQVFSAVQEVGTSAEKRLLRYIAVPSHPFALKRERDLLRYLNQFSQSFPHLYEVRQAGLGILQIFQFVGQKNLQKRVQEQGALSEKEVWRLLREMVQTLSHVHQVGFVHGDIKPENIVCGEEDFYLIDWSQAMPAKRCFETEKLIGDKRYSPPERLQGIYTEKSDLFSLGCTLFFALTGQPLFPIDKEASAIEKLYRLAMNEAQGLDSLPLFWQRLIAHLVQKEPKLRPSLEEVKRCMENQTILPALPASAIPSEDLDEVPHEVQKMIEVLAQQGFAYAKFKQAVVLESQGEALLSIELYQEVAEQGYSRAMNNLGKLLIEKGQFKQGEQWLKQALKMQNPYAAYNLAYFHQKAKLNSENEKVVSWLKFSAWHGYLKAQTTYGQWLQQQGKTEDGEYWLKLAAIRGDQQAKQFLLTS